jgi:hypothetical protein
LHLVGYIKYTPLGLLGRVSRVTAPHDLNVDSIRKGCQLRPLAALNLQENVLVSQEVEASEVAKRKYPGLRM